MKKRNHNVLATFSVRVGCRLVSKVLAVIVFSRGV